MDENGASLRDFSADCYRVTVIAGAGSAVSGTQNPHQATHAGDASLI